MLPIHDSRSPRGALHVGRLLGLALLASTLTVGCGSMDSSALGMTADDAIAQGASAAGLSLSPEMTQQITSMLTTLPWPDNQLMNSAVAAVQNNAPLPQAALDALTQMATNLVDPAVAETASSVLSMLGYPAP